MDNAFSFFELIAAKVSIAAIDNFLIKVVQCIPCFSFVSANTSLIVSLSLAYIGFISCDDTDKHPHHLKFY